MAKDLVVDPLEVMCWNETVTIEILYSEFLAMSDVSDVAPLPSTPSRNGDDMDIGMSPGGGICIL